MGFINYGVDGSHVAGFAYIKVSFSRLVLHWLYTHVLLITKNTRTKEYHIEVGDGGRGGRNMLISLLELGLQLESTLGSGLGFGHG